MRPVPFHDPTSAHLGRDPPTPVVDDEDDELDFCRRKRSLHWPVQDSYDYDNTRSMRQPQYTEVGEGDDNEYDKDTKDDRDDDIEDRGDEEDDDNGDKYAMEDNTSEEPLEEPSGRRSGSAALTCPPTQDRPTRSTLPCRQLNISVLLWWDTHTEDTRDVFNWRMETSPKPVWDFRSLD